MTSLPLTPFLHLGGGYPRLSPDILRNLRRGCRNLAADRLRAVIRFDRDPAVIAALKDEITTAYLARCKAARRRPDLDRLAADYDRVLILARTADDALGGEVATLRIGGELAAWELAVLDSTCYRVVAGQMTPGFERYRPGRLLEAVLIGRALTEPPAREWHPRARCAVTRRFTDVVWGTDGRHRDALIAVS